MMSSLLEGQDQLRSNIAEVYVDSGQEWLRALPSLIATLGARWNFRLLKVVPDLTYSFVAVVSHRDRETRILKIAPPGERIRSEIAWYQVNPDGGAEVFASDHEAGALLMEHLIPGSSAKVLVQQGDDDGATRAICEVIKKLRPVPCTHQKFELVADLGASMELLRGMLDARLVDEASRLFEDITGDPTTHRIVHGDLHHDNVLLGRKGWCGIDPHGYFGPPAFEVGAMIHNPRDAFPGERPLEATIHRRLAILSEELPFTRKEIIGWSLVHTLLAASWSLTDHGKIPRDHVEVAEIISRFNASYPRSLTVPPR